MSTVKERYQNPTYNENVRLRLFFYNSNNFSDVAKITKIDLYKVENGKSINDPSARTFVRSVNPSSVVKDGTGRYYVDVFLEEGVFLIGQYVDVWTVQFVNEDQDTSEIVNPFQVYPNLWYSTPIPVVYDFDFIFRPNKIRKGSKRYLIVEITPNVPKGTDLQRYYENLAIVADLKISMELKCGNCVPDEEDLRIVIDRAPVDYREKKYGYFMLDTTEIEVGVYDVWFELEMGENNYISDRMNLQIYK
jgi:hypothetical protein